MARTQIWQHMFPRDIAPFASYVLSPEGQTYTSWQFDVIIGNPTDPGPFYPANKRRQALYLGALKIDAVGWLFASPTLIEAKPDADAGSIGQIDSYADWYRMTYGIYPRKMIVCSSMREQIQQVASWHNIEVRIVQEADPQAIEAAINYTIPLIKPSPLFANPLEVPR